MINKCFQVACDNYVEQKPIAQFYSHISLQIIIWFFYGSEDNKYKIAWPATKLVLCSAILEASEWDVKLVICQWFRMQSEAEPS